MYNRVQRQSSVTRKASRDQEGLSPHGGGFQSGGAQGGEVQPANLVPDHTSRNHAGPANNDNYCSIWK